MIEIAFLMKIMGEVLRTADVCVSGPEMHISAAYGISLIILSKKHFWSNLLSFAKMLEGKFLKNGYFSVFFFQSD